MENMHNETLLKCRKGRLWALALCIIGIAVNFICSYAAEKAGSPFYFDTLGTVAAAVFGGYLPGISVGLFTNLIKNFNDNVSVYYSLLNVLIAILTHYFNVKGYLKRFHTIVLYVISMAFVGGILGSVLTFIFEGSFIYVGYKEFTDYLCNNIFAGNHDYYLGCSLAASFLVDLADKAVTAAIVLLAYKCTPQGIKDIFCFGGWQQYPLTREDEKKLNNAKCRTVSLRARILGVLIVAAVSIASIVTFISSVIHQESAVNENTNLAKSVASVGSGIIDASKVDEYIEKGEKAEGYKKTEKLLYRLRESSADIEYIYVYKIAEDGCHVVFDLDTEDMKGSEPGEVVEFDESFADYLPDLLAGKEIEPIISNDKYGWLLTLYEPVYDDNGVCKCYVGVDISMARLTVNENIFFAKLLALFLGFFALIIALGMWLAKYNLVMPINTMAASVSKFAYKNERSMDEGLAAIERIDIHTGDELENLYNAFLEMTKDSVGYVADIQKKTETISEMQDALIMVLADIVESRDQCTGDHIRKTAAYVKIIIDEMRKKGYYSGQIDDKFASDVVKAAPLHDIGKIKVPDAVLNKPGKLTDEEFDIIKSHAAAGEEIIERVIATIPESGYLQEAKNLAAFHHEKWNGRGYPRGISGEDIPLSARIMAVADVFDALVSRRSYKAPFTFEKAMSIIQEDAGVHFDPLVADAFVSAADTVREVAETFDKMNENYYTDNKPEQN